MSEVANSGSADVTKRTVTIVIEDAEGGFHLSLDVDPPLAEDGSEVRPTPALIAGSVARRAIQELVAQQPPAGGSN
jgi:hypothetical protein